MVPVDGLVVSEAAALDESALTGEALPVVVRKAGPVSSGTASRAPISTSGDGGRRRQRVRRPRPTCQGSGSVTRALCQARRSLRRDLPPDHNRRRRSRLGPYRDPAGHSPSRGRDTVPLILAAPSRSSQVSRAARAGIVVKGGGPVEKLGEARTVLLDKTGTPTPGHRESSRSSRSTPSGLTKFFGSRPRSISSSATLSWTAVAREAHDRHLELSIPTDATRVFLGATIQGVLDGRPAVGSLDWLTARKPPRRYHAGAAAALDQTESAGQAKILVGVDGRLIGAIVMADHVRADAAVEAATTRRSARQASAR